MGGWGLIGEFDDSVGVDVRKVVLRTRILEDRKISAKRSPSVERE